MAQELVMYTRTATCPWVSLARQVLRDNGLPYREVNIDQDPAARERLLGWTGFLSVPTILVAEPGSDLPIAPPAPLAQGASPRGIDRGVMITEPDAQQLAVWLLARGFLGQ